MKSKETSKNILNYEKNPLVKFSKEITKVKSSFFDEFDI